MKNLSGLKTRYIFSFLILLFVINSCGAAIRQIKKQEIIYNELRIIRDRQYKVQEECTKIIPMPVSRDPRIKYRRMGCYIFNPEKKWGIVYYSANIRDKEMEKCYLEHELAHHYKRIFYPYNAWRKGHKNYLCGPPEKGLWNVAAKNIMKIMDKMLLEKKQ